MEGARIMLNDGRKLTPDRCFEEALRDAFNTFYESYNKYKSWMETQHYRFDDDD